MTIPVRQKLGKCREECKPDEQGNKGVQLLIKVGANQRLVNNINSLTDCLMSLCQQLTSHVIPMTVPMLGGGVVDVYDTVHCLMVTVADLMANEC